MGLTEEYEKVQGAKDSSIVAKFENLGFTLNDHEPQIITIMTVQKALMLFRNSHPDSFTAE